MLSFERDIRPMFTDTDVAHMKKMMDLSSRDAVFENADAIYTTVSEGTMPPPGTGEPWTPEMCEKFLQWQKEGGQP